MSEELEDEPPVYVSSEVPAWVTNIDQDETHATRESLVEVNIANDSQLDYSKMEEYLQERYKKYAPEKLKNIPNVLAVFEGKESFLLHSLQEKYKLRENDYILFLIEGEDIEEVTRESLVEVHLANDANVDYSKSKMTGYLTERYKEHAPEKLGNIPNVMEVFQGKEAFLLNLIREKYNLREEDYAIYCSENAEKFQVLPVIDSAEFKATAEHSNASKDLERSFESPKKEGAPPPLPPPPYSAIEEFEVTFPPGSMGLSLIAHHFRGEEQVGCRVRQWCDTKEGIKEKLKFGDLLIKVDDLVTEELTFTETMQELQIRLHAEKTVTFRREVHEDYYEFRFAPGPMGLHLQARNSMGEDHMGIQIAEFSAENLPKEQYDEQQLNAFYKDMRIGDYISHVDGRDIEEWTFDQSMEYLKGIKDQAKTVTFRKEEEESKDLVTLAFPPGPMGLTLIGRSVDGSVQMGCMVKSFDHTKITQDGDVDYFNCGIREGDCVTHANGRNLHGLTFDEIMAILQSVTDATKTITFNRSAQFGRTDHLAGGVNTITYDLPFPAGPMGLTLRSDRMDGDEQLGLRVKGFNGASIQAEASVATRIADQLRLDDVVMRVNGTDYTHVAFDKAMQMLRELSNQEKVITFSRNPNWDSSQTLAQQIAAQTQMETLQRQEQEKRDRAMAEALERERRDKASALEYANAARRMRSEIQCKRESQDKRVPRSIRYIRWCMFRVNNCMALMGPMLFALAMWAYFKDLHLDYSSSEAQTIIVLQVMFIVVSGFMTFLGMLGNQAFKEPKRERKHLHNRALNAYALFNIALCFCSFYLLSTVYNVRLEFIKSNSAMKSTYTNRFDVNIGTTGQNGLSGFPSAPVYGANERIIAKFFNMIFFGATSVDYDGDPSNDACNDPSFGPLWMYLHNYCPDTINWDNCAPCNAVYGAEYGITSCYADKRSCDTTFEPDPDSQPHFSPYYYMSASGDLLHEQDKNLGCPYEICRANFLEDGVKRMQVLQYFVELLTLIECTMVISTIVYMWTYGQYYRTAVEDVEAHKSKDMVNGVHKYSKDLNDSILRSDLFSSIEFPSEEAEYEATKDDEEQYRDLVSKSYTLGIQPGEKGFPI